MAQFLKIPLTGVANTPYQLVSIANIVTAVAGDNAGANLTTTVTLRCNAAAAFDSITITASDAAATAGDLLKAFNDAIIANPGGFVSTVVPPLTTAQVPAAGGGGADGKGQGGRTVITTPAAFATFTGVDLN